jgi:glycosyltransferase involved in cell wall biosynthesis
MRVAYVCPSFMRFSRRGATSMDLFVSECVSFSRHKATTVVFGRPVDAPLAGLNFASNRALLTGDGPAGDEIQFARGFVDAVRAFRPDVIDVQQHAPTAALLAWAMPRTPVLLMRHNETGPVGDVVRQAAERLRYRLFAGVAFCSEWVRGRFSRWYPELAPRAYVLHNGIDTERWSPPAGKKEKIVLCVGRMVPEKGVVEFARAALRFLPDHPDWRGVIVTSVAPEHRAYADEVQAIAGSLPQQLEVVHNATHDAVMDWYLRAEIAVVPSRWEEPLGRTAIEAMCAGAALVSSGTGGLKEVSGDEAVFAAPEPEPLAQAVGRLIDDEALRERLRRAGRARIIERFDLRRVASRADALHEHIAGAAGKPRREIVLDRSPAGTLPEAPPASA